MKFLVLAIVVIAVTAVSAVSEDKKAQLKAYGKECVESTGVDTKLITALRAGSITDDQKLKEFIACVWQKTGSLKADGTFDKAVIARDLADNKVVSDVALKCADVTGPTAADTAFLSYKCFRANLPADYKAPW
nr:uncharacterized protein LOC111425357 [Onthophagus taurus]